MSCCLICCEASLSVLIVAGGDMWFSWKRVHRIVCIYSANWRAHGWQHPSVEDGDNSIWMARTCRCCSVAINDVAMFIGLLQINVFFVVLFPVWARTHSAAGVWHVLQITVKTGQKSLWYFIKVRLQIIGHRQIWQYIGVCLAFFNGLSKSLDVLRLQRVIVSTAFCLCIFCCNSVRCVWTNKIFFKVPRIVSTWAVIHQQVLLVFWVRELITSLC